MNITLSPGRRLRPGQLEMLVLLAIVLLALALRAYHLGTKSLWLDELNLLRSADGHGSLFRRFSNTPNYSLDHPPAYLLLLRVVILTIGREEWMVRLPALVVSNGPVSLGPTSGEASFWRLQGRNELPSGNTAPQRSRTMATQTPISF